MKTDTAHKLHSCSSAWCTVCRLKQQHCTICQARDRELPTDCPGREMTKPELDAIYHRDLDYVTGRWVDGLL